MTAEHYYWLAIGWMWFLGAGMLWMFIDEMLHYTGKTAGTVAICLLWPIALPSCIAFYVAFGQQQD
jgi:hypothetical protein